METQHTIEVKPPLRARLPGASRRGGVKLDGLLILSGLATVPFIAAMVLVAVLDPPEPIPYPFVQETIIRELRQGRILGVSWHYETLDLSLFTGRIADRSPEAPDPIGASDGVPVQYRLVPEDVLTEKSERGPLKGRKVRARFLRCRLERILGDSATVSAGIVHFPEFVDRPGGGRNSTEPLFRVEEERGKRRHVRLTIHAWAYFMLSNG